MAHRPPFEGYGKMTITQGETVSGERKRDKRGKTPGRMSGPTATLDSALGPDRVHPTITGGLATPYDPSCLAMIAIPISVVAVVISVVAISVAIPTPAPIIPGADTSSRMIIPPTPTPTPIVPGAIFGTSQIGQTRDN